MKLIEKPTFDSFRNIKIFKDISDQDLKMIYNKVECRNYEREETIIQEQTKGDNVYILTSGKVKIVKQVNDERTEVLGYYSEQGGLFGEMAVLEDKPRSAGMIADSNCEILTVTKDNFIQLVENVSAFSVAVAKNISQFLRETDERLIKSLKEENDQLRHANYMLQETQEALINKERLALIGRMASTILHDMKNPMSTIGGYAQLIKLKKHTQTQLNNYADIISRQVIQFTSMAQDLLSFAQGGEELLVKSIQANVYFQECCDSLDLKFVDKKINLKRDLKFDGDIRIDGSRFFRVLDNIAVNALDVLEPGGTFRVATQAVDTGLRLILEDDGPGMPEEVKQNAFKEFYTFGKRKGTGLGLAIVKRIVDEHEGVITVESSEAEGTRFLIDLPAVGYDLLPGSKHQIPIPFNKNSQQSVQS
ncbi:MAG: cyclic nucleotide-binding domain-containing protein [Candidatus Marinimicrobia bacterium]|nr:cyclic nucleotide-binding domain-containing protein [Candidatus Neomarinimicrobiota bacterium]MCF7850634.1 cyclic nucleotide-binding domain-containing protein [Candidatus Neomarinimicrobiota bacterium]MCF7903632.1 cyclic nucleotide-binding domain-containing protein [Candidatus Neomarinimicrobiota bacterium]